jgi:hypothetical protein
MLDLCHQLCYRPARLSIALALLVRPHRVTHPLVPANLHNALKERRVLPVELAGEDPELLAVA